MDTKRRLLGTLLSWIPLECPRLQEVTNQGNPYKRLPNYASALDTNDACPQIGARWGEELVGGHMKRQYYGCSWLLRMACCSGSVADTMRSSKSITALSVLYSGSASANKEK
eukprot:6462382-Amphidinium_carterae.3